MKMPKKDLEVAIEKFAKVIEKAKELGKKVKKEKERGKASR